MRAELCSGPWPSKPCGSSSTRPFCLAPLVLGGHEVLVDDDLRAVDEVAELRLPHHQRVVVGVRVAVLEAERGVLAEQAVVHPEAGLSRRASVLSGIQTFSFS